MRVAVDVAEIIACVVCVCVCIAACAAHCYQCNSAGAGLCDSGQCFPTYTVAEDKSCQGQSVQYSLGAGASASIQDYTHIFQGDGWGATFKTLGGGAINYQHFVRLKMHQIYFRLGLCPRFHWGS